MDAHPGEEIQKPNFRLDNSPDSSSSSSSNNNNNKNGNYHRDGVCGCGESAAVNGELALSSGLSEVPSATTGPSGTRRTLTWTNA